MRLGDPPECRQRAAYCFQRAAISASPLAREKLANMAETWIKLAIQLEDQMALLEQGEAGLGSPSKAGS
jgi:hypothetical protein